jgi:hypothetical protein
MNADKTNQFTFSVFTGSEVGQAFLPATIRGTPRIVRPDHAAGCVHPAAADKNVFPTKAMIAPPQMCVTPERGHKAPCVPKKLSRPVDSHSFFRPSHARS